MLSGKRIAFVGAGNMAEALVKGLVASGAVRARDLVASDRHPERAARVAQRHGIAGLTDNAACVEGARS